MSRLYAVLLEVCLVALSTLLVWWLLEVYLGWLKFWGHLFKALWVPLILCAIILSRRSFRDYGFLPRSLRLALKWSLIFIATFTLPAIVLISASVALGAAKPVGLSPLEIALNIIWYMVFVGLVEEAYFRGYVQSRLNEIFERRWHEFIFKAWKVDWGVSLLLTSMIFALMHIANYWNPLASRWEPAWYMPIHILGGFAFGCLAGALREASGDVYVPSSLHGGLMTAYTFLSIYANELALNISLFISWFIFFYMLAIFFHEFESLKFVA
ncbi:MAG: CPBP family intramembrane glutamic endopeptidase [Desulfurococcaceae archaeon]